MYRLAEVRMKHDSLEPLRWVVLTDLLTSSFLIAVRVSYGDGAEM